MRACQTCGRSRPESMRQLNVRNCLYRAVRQLAEEWSMKIVRQITVFDAADIAAESAFWARLLAARSMRTMTFIA